MSTRTDFINYPALVRLGENWTRLGHFPVGPGAHHSLLSRRSGTSLIYYFNTERGVHWLLPRDAPLTPVVVVDTFSQKGYVKHEIGHS